MSPSQAWWLAIRPKTLSLAASPVIVGNSLAWAQQGHLNWTIALATLVAALLIQIGTNLYNDAADHERGTDSSDRLGPARATAQGWLSAHRVKRGALVSFAAALLIGIYLAAVGGWPLLLLGLVSIATGYAYSGGPRPIAYSATGELFVFLFFGLFAVAGSHYLQTLSFEPATLMAGAALGCMAAAVLVVNNYRDLDSDRRAQRLTLCHSLGRPGTRHLYAALLVLPFLLAPWSLTSPGDAWMLLGALPPALLLIRRFYFDPPGAGLNRVLASTARLQLVFGLLFSLGAVA
jgi:1,4-dihydroxy-2-naphthoate octaprenyltransferase